MKNKTRILARYLQIYSLAAIFLLVQPVLALEEGTAIELNNNGIEALNKGDTKAAIETFEAAIKKDPSYRMAQDNLAIAHNNYALSLRKTDTEQAIKHFHAALFYSPDNPTARDNLESTIRAIGRDPKSFKDRVELGDKALREKDYMGAKVEYEVALSIEKSADVQNKYECTKEILVETQPVGSTKKKSVADIPEIDFGPYMAELQRRIKRAYHYSGKNSMGKPPMVAFRIRKDGSLSDLMMPRSCGVPAADEALMKAVNDSAPFPPLPAGAKDYVDIQFGINSCPAFSGSPYTFRRF